MFCKPGYHGNHCSPQWHAAGDAFLLNSDMQRVCCNALCVDIMVLVIGKMVSESLRVTTNYLAVNSLLETH